ncbi:MAG: M48 family metallopeptidase [Candidatus Thermoplasmatota archaeon]|jgi:predicted metal-dependent hydrolase|nr:M48 family metallopeptidase [Candidatus Thermoplasmatota archaeon]
MDDVEIIRSKRRKNTIQAKFVKEKLLIYLPSGMTKHEEKKWIEKMIKWGERHKKRKQLNDMDLFKRAQELNKLYFNGSLDFSIRFVTNQNTRFGSCTSATKSIRISDRLAKMPRWVQDYVIIHELAHILHPNHTKKFWEKVNQYKYAERAKGYLIAVGMKKDDDL